MIYGCLTITRVTPLEETLQIFWCKGTCSYTYNMVKLWLNPSSLFISYEFWPIICWKKYTILPSKEKCKKWNDRNKRKNVKEWRKNKKSLERVWFDWVGLVELDDSACLTQGESYAFFIYFRGSLINRLAFIILPAKNQTF